MDAEFIDFLDKKFNRLEAKIDGVETSLNKKIDGVETSLNKKIDGVQMDLNTKFFSLKEDIASIDRRLTKLEEAVQNLTNNVDRMIHMYEDVKAEQKMIIADIFRIKNFLHEKMGMEI